MFIDFVRQQALFANRPDRPTDRWGFCANCGEEIPLSSHYVEEELIRIGLDVLLFEVGRCPRPGCEALTHQMLGKAGL